MSWPFHLLLATFPELFINQHHWSDVVCHIVLPKTQRSKHWPDTALYTTHHISFKDDLNIININLLLFLGPEIGFFYISFLKDIFYLSPWTYFCLLRDTIKHIQYSLLARGTPISDQQGTISKIAPSLCLRPDTTIFCYFFFSDSWSSRLNFLVNCYLFYSCNSLFSCIFRMLPSAFPLIPSNEKIKRWASCELISDYSYLLCWNSAVYHEARESNLLVPQKLACLILIPIIVQVSWVRWGQF